MALSYRIALPADASAICSFWNGPSGSGVDGAADAVRKLFPGEPVQSWVPSQITAMMENRTRFALAELDGEIVCFIQFTIARESGAMHIDILAFVPETTGEQGAGYIRGIMRRVHAVLPANWSIEVPRIPARARAARQYLDARYATVIEHEDYDQSRTYIDTVTRLRTVE